MKTQPPWRKEKLALYTCCIWKMLNTTRAGATRWPGEDGSFRIIHSGAEESQQGVAIILHKRTANCMEKGFYGEKKLFTGKMNL